MSEAASGRGYRFGRFQGWATIILSIPLFVAPFVGMSIILPLALFLMTLGVGLLLRRKFAVVMLYFLGVGVLLGGYAKVTHPEQPVIHLVFLVLWVIPAFFYYPKRWKEMK